MMFSRDIEVHSLNLESQRLVNEAEMLMRELRQHQAALGTFIHDARRQIAASPTKNQIEGRS
jgi:hypothetical protein